MAWYKVSFTNEQIEGQAMLNKLENEFTTCYMAADGPSDMALFSDNDYQDGRISIYFTPGCETNCANLISEYGAEACEPPDTSDVFLLTGNDDALDLINII